MPCVGVHACVYMCVNTQGRCLVWFGVQSVHSVGTCARVCQRCPWGCMCVCTSVQASGCLGAHVCTVACSLRPVYLRCFTCPCEHVCGMQVHVSLCACVHVHICTHALTYSHKASCVHVYVCARVCALGAGYVCSSVWACGPGVCIYTCAVYVRVCMHVLVHVCQSAELTLGSPGGRQRLASSAPTRGPLWSL